MKDVGRILGTESCRVQKKALPHHRDCFRITVHSDMLFDFCYGLVGSTAKSKNRLPVPDVPGPYVRHFVRGFFDGDGSISMKRYRTRHGKEADALQTSFTAGLMTDDFLERLRDLIRSHIPVGFKKVHVGRTNRKLIFNQYDSMLLCEWMYQDATIYMERKKAVWDSCDKERLARSKKFFSNKV